MGIKLTREVTRNHTWVIRDYYGKDPHPFATLALSDKEMKALVEQYHALKNERRGSRGAALPPDAQAS